MWLSRKQRLSWSGCRYIYPCLDSISSHDYLSYTTILCVKFRFLNHFLSGFLSSFVQWGTSSILISEECAQETTTRSRIIHLPVCVKVNIRMRRVRCIVFLGHGETMVYLLTHDFKSAQVVLLCTVNSHLNEHHRQPNN
jgi:hypothetical protein